MTTKTNTTMWDRLFSSYVSKTYRGDRAAFERIQEYFREAARTTEEAWEYVHEREDEAVFKKGQPVALTFDYRSPTLEVRSIVGYDADEGTITVTVGNQGFPGEVHLARARYLALLDKIDAYIAENGIAVAVED
jgi:beta-glucosidase-like glycosyl hydrolase